MVTHMLIALAGSLATAVYFILLARYARESPGFDSTQALTVTHLIGAILTTLAALATPTVSLPSWNAPLIGTLLLATLPLVLSRKLYLYAYARMDVAYVTIFSPLTPVYAIVFGMLWYHTQPSFAELAGITIIILAIYTLFGQTPKSLWHLLRSPRFWSLPVCCAFASTLPTAFAALAQKQALDAMHPLLLAAVIQWGVCACLLLYDMATTRRLPHFTYLTHPSMLAAGVLFGLSNIAFNYILVAEQASVTLALQRMSAVFQIFLAHWWLKQYDNSLNKILSGIAAFIGFLILVYS